MLLTDKRKLIGHYFKIQNNQSK